MKVRFVMVYTPYGYWENKYSDKVDVIGNHYCKHNEKDLIMIQGESVCAPSHGEPLSKSLTPKYYDKSTLKPVDIGSDFIEIV